MELRQLNWHPYNHNALKRLIEQSKHAGNYVVFDWDYTCIFNDTQNALFNYQIDNLLFHFTPEEFSDMLRYNIPNIHETTKLTNDEGEALSPAMIADDLDSLYHELYHQYEGLGGSSTLEKIHSTKTFHDFKALMHMYTHVVFQIKDLDMSQVICANFDTKEYRDMVKQSINTALKTDISKITLRSSDQKRTKNVTLSTRHGVRIREEIKDLFRTLTENGIEIYIISASQIDNVRVFASDSDYGYGVKEEHVFGRRREVVDGKFTIKDDDRYCFIYGKGKTKDIQEILSKKHGKPPILIAGDSDGDFDMMNTYKDDATLLVFNRNFKNRKISTLVEEGLKNREKSDSKILVQDFFLQDLNL